MDNGLNFYQNLVGKNIAKNLTWQGKMNLKKKIWNTYAEAEGRFVRCGMADSSFKCSMEEPVFALHFFWLLVRVRESRE